MGHIKLNSDSRILGQHLSQYKKNPLPIYLVSQYKKNPLPIYLAKVSAGFPSPADDYLEDKLDLNELLIQHPSATFFIRVSGSTWAGEGIHDQDILIVDRSLNPCHGKIVVAVIAGEVTLKKFFQRNSKIQLLSAQKNSTAIEIHPQYDDIIWGVVKYVIHRF